MINSHPWMTIDDKKKEIEMRNDLFQIRRIITITRRYG